MSMSAESDEQPTEETAAVEPTSQDGATDEAITEETQASAVELESGPPIEAEAAVPATAANNDEPVSKKKPSSKKQRKSSSRIRQKNQPTLRQVTDRFAACGRCGYFWAGYRVIYGKDALETAVAQSEADWLDLEWNWQMPDLVHKSYGVRLDITHFHYEGCCQECRRPFVFQASDSEDELDSFEIGITPTA